MTNERSDYNFILLNFFQICVYKYQSKSSEEQSQQENAESSSADPTKPGHTSRLKQLTDKFLKHNHSPLSDDEIETENEKDSNVEKGEKFRQVLQKLDQLMKMDQEIDQLEDDKPNLKSDFES